MTNQDFANSDPLFRKACELAHVDPSKRQASKWNSKRGRAREFYAAAVEILGMKNGKALDSIRANL